MKRIVTCDEMRALEQSAFDAGVSSYDMMEEASTHVANAVMKEAPEGKIVVFCGGGNNGGDGLASARILSEHGRDVDVVLLSDPESMPPDARTNARRLSECFARIIPLKTVGTDYAAAVDAVLGIGIRPRAFSEPIRSAVEKIRLCREAGVKVISVDIPSGIVGDTGLYADDIAVEADITVTFAAKKPAHLLFPGRACCGEVRVGSLTGVDLSENARFVQITAEDADRSFPTRPMNSHKGTYGHALILAGSRGMTGAGCLSASAALSAGAGLVSWAYPDGAFPAFPWSVMAKPVPSENGRFSPVSLEEVMPLLLSANALGMGPGLGRSPEVSSFVREILRRWEHPMVLDADGIFALGGELDLLAGHDGILTPHPGEMSYLTGRSIAEISRDPVGTAEYVAERTGWTVLLKGGTTWIAKAGCPTAAVISGNPGMATAGSGDVLTGILTSLMAQGLSAYDAACAGAYIHGAAGTAAALAQGMAPITATDILGSIPKALPERKWNPAWNL